MPSRSGSSHVVTTSRKYKGKIYQTHLLRRSYREGKKVRNETLANLSHLPAHVIDLIRRSLHGESFTATGEAFEIVRSLPHGDSQAVLAAMKSLGFASLLSSRPCKERDIILAVVAARILRASPKLSTTRFWKTRTLADDAGVANITENEIYAAMDWLLTRQPSIEKKLAQRHIKQGDVVLYDLSSSYFEGRHCPMAKLGYNRDGKHGKLQVNYGLLCNAQGCPVSISVFDGNTSDTKTLLPAVTKLQNNFGVKTFIMVGDRGMISQASIDVLKEHHTGVQWITALKSCQIKTLLTQGHLQPDLFDQRNLFELSHFDYPGERLIACKNHELAKKRALTRISLIEATEKSLAQVEKMVVSGKLADKDKIGVRVGRVIDKYKVAKHFLLNIADKKFSFERNQESIDVEAMLDGIYMIRTNVKSETLNSDDAVRTYKSLAQVERAFRTMKTVDLHVRPIHHRTEDRVRSHIFLCMLAYWIEWHMRKAWGALLFHDEHPNEKRDPVAPAKRSTSALKKAQSKKTADETPVHSFRTLLDFLGTIVRNTCRPKGADSASTFFMTTQPNPEQLRALNLIAQIM